MVDSTLLKKYNFKEEEIEIASGQEGYKTGFPKPKKAIRFTIESPTLSLEESYFWLLNFIKHDVGFYDVKKITDIFTGSELSMFWGQAQQRLNFQQDRAMSLMKYISDLTKALFQIFRELKAVDERLDIYKGVRKGNMADAITLKSYWVDLVEGGAKNPSSVLGLASEQIGFVLLPDLFFTAKPNLTKKQLDDYIKNLKMGNRKIKEMLMRKLNQYIEWRDLTEKELTIRRKFLLKDLRFKYNSILLYSRWLNPYLRAAKKLSGSSAKEMSPELISAFETSLMEVEILARQPQKDYHPIILMNITYTTKPMMNFHSEDYRHKGPIHVGKMEVQLKGYAWSDKEYENYIKMKQDEEFQLLGEIDSSVKSLLDSMGDDLKQYLKEAGENIEVEKKEEKKQTSKAPNQSVFEPFLSLLNGFGEIGKLFFPYQKKKKTPREIIESQKQAKKTAEDTVEKLLFVVYNIYKKSHSMLSD